MKKTLLFPVLALLALLSAGFADPVSSPARAAEAQPFTPDTAYMTDRELLDKLQRDAFAYMWDHAYPSGLAFENNR